MHQTNLTRYRLYLYVFPDYASRAVGAESEKACHAPPLRFERLTLKSVLAAGKLAQMVFSLPAKPKICWDEISCWLDCSFVHLDGAFDPIFKDAEDLLRALPLMQEWIGEWACSDSRTPNLAPKWATQRGLDSVEVQQVARFLLERVATDRCLSLAFSSVAGKEVALTVPPRAALRLPPTASDFNAIEQITAKEEYVVWATPVGQRVTIAADLVPTDSQFVVVDPGALAHLKVTNATKVRTVTGPAEDEKNDD